MHLKDLNPLYEKLKKILDPNPLYEKQMHLEEMVLEDPNLYLVRFKRLLHRLLHLKFQC
jgi:hypothetical protein